MLTPYFAWGAELTGDYAERGRVSVWRETAGLVGTILAAVLYSLGADAAEGMRNIALLIILAMPAACILCLAFVPEPRNFSRVSAGLGSLARVPGEPLFGRLIRAFFVNSVANALPAGLFLFFVGQRLGAPAWGGAAADRVLRRRRARRAALAVAGEAAREAQDLVLGHALCLRRVRRRALAARRGPRGLRGDLRAERRRARRRSVAADGHPGGLRRSGHRAVGRSADRCVLCALVAGAEVRPSPHFSPGPS